jgi:hypothetical protein
MLGVGKNHQSDTNTRGAKIYETPTYRLDSDLSVQGLKSVNPKKLPLWEDLAQKRSERQQAFDLRFSPKSHRAFLVFGQNKFSARVSRSHIYVSGFQPQVQITRCREN